MCGIFGIISTGQFNPHNSDLVIKLFKNLADFSTARGRESSGFFIETDSESFLFKSANAANILIKNDKTIAALKKASTAKKSLCLMGHSRLVTNGRGALNKNNQPLYFGERVMFHNGIITNCDALAKSNNIKTETESDTEILLKLFNQYTNDQNLSLSATQTLDQIEGTASCAVFDAQDNNVILFTDNGSLYYTLTEAGFFIYASERYILSQSLKKLSIDGAQINQLKPRTSHVINRRNKSNKVVSINALYHQDYPNFETIKRCTKCLLPESFPGITFDKYGVCSECHSYEQIKLKPMDELKRQLDKYRSKDGSADCIVGVSGGRDSCYGLHLIKNEFGMNPIAYTYDWGLVTDLARRNVARMCGKLGVEHILISADIRKKRKNVRRNIEAWLGYPQLGMIPLFMAGDKQFYEYAHNLRKQTGIDLFFFAAGNKLETTNFKTRFAGLSDSSGQGILTKMPAISKINMIFYYLRNFLFQPRYINSSLVDTFSAFRSTYLLKDDYLYLYHYFPWDEDTVNSTLINQYGWEIAPDSTSTWRIGDGTAAFYNYIYYVVAGFTEHDTFRSNQIREGVMTREVAFEKLRQDNQPRWESLQWYANTIGFNLDEALNIIHKMDKLY